MITTDKLQTASNRVFYEYWMLDKLAEILNRELAIEDDKTLAGISSMLNSTGIIKTASVQTSNLLVTNNACIEAFGIHARALLEFFYGLEILEKRKRKRHPDDIFAEDFFDEKREWVDIRPPTPDDYDSIRERINKEIAHITYKGAKVEAKTKMWLFVNIRDAIKTAYTIFSKCVPKERLGERWEW